MMIEQGLPLVDKHKVVVLTITYNHSKYIEDALKGFAMQQTDFPFLCCVFDDASTDGEQEVLKKWIENHCNPNEIEVYDHPLTIILKAPDKMNPNCIYVIHLQKVNTWGKPEKKRLVNYWSQLSEYIALCEGDDYWTDPLKLQKQVDVLESNKNISLVYTAFFNVNQNGIIIRRTFHDKIIRDSKSGDLLYKLFLGNFIMTMTVCFRREVLFLEKYIDSPYHMDYSLFISATELGDFVYIPDKTGAYRMVLMGEIKSRKKQVDTSLCLIYKYFADNFLRKKMRERKLKSRLRIKLAIVNRAIRLLQHQEFSCYLYDFICKDKTLLFLVPISIIDICIEKIAYFIKK